MKLASSRVAFSSDDFSNFSRETVVKKIKMSS